MEMVHSVIWIDFHGSTHGHFLEYVVNTWIMGMPEESQSVFTDTGACHNFSESYKNSRKVYCGHWNWSGYKRQLPHEPVIRITIDRFDDRLFYIALVNRWYRSGDVSFEQKMLDIPDHVRQDQAALRDQYFYKYQYRDKHIDHYHDFQPIPNPVQEFPFAAFFSWSEFCTGLHKIADFLQRPFCPTKSLYKLWQEFIRINQGWHSYQHCEKILQSVFDDQSHSIECTAYEEGWLNYTIFKITGQQPNELFKNQEYPRTTDQFYQMIQSYVRKN